MTRDQQLREKYLHNPMVELDSPFTDARGAIIPVIDEDMKSAVIIESKKGTIRANHFHKTDWHYCYVLSGEIDYLWRETGLTSSPKKITIKKGECFFTPNLVDHAMVFTQDTVFLCLGRNPRDQKSYEADIEKVILA
jgi:dTDP-4-dehydrorhamnose 3,5-epimerase-like enzyme